QDASVRHAAAFALGHIGPAAASAAPALANARQSNDPLMQTVSAWALAHIEPKNEEVRREAVTLLTARLKDKNPRVQGAALRGLVELKPDAKTLLPSLSLVVTEGDPGVIQDALSVVA